jgi:hypothetical protein
MSSEWDVLIWLCLLQIVMDWAKTVAYQQGEQYWITTATVLPYGSYDLGVRK